MKKLLFICGIALSFNASAQGVYKLKKPLISLGDTVKVVTWRTINYPATKEVYWQLKADTNSVQHVVHGNAILPDDVNISSAGEWLEKIKVWAIRQEY